MEYIINPFTGLLDATGINGNSQGILTINSIAPDGSGNFTLTAGKNIQLTGGTNSITIASGMAIVNQTSSSVTMSVNTVYEINNGASLVTLTLPVTASVGDLIKIVGQSSGGWSIAQNSGQSIKYPIQTTTTGVGGSLASTNQYNVVLLHCVIANTTWVVEYATGPGLTFV